MQRTFQQCLDTGGVGLALPAGEVRTIIGQDESNISHRGVILPRDRRFIHQFILRAKVNRRPCGWKSKCLLTSKPPAMLFNYLVS